MHRHQQSTHINKHVSTQNLKITEGADDLLDFYNLGLEDESWQRIVKTLTQKGFFTKKDDLQLDEEP